MALLSTDLPMHGFLNPDLSFVAVPRVEDVKGSVMMPATILSHRTIRMAGVEQNVTP